MAQRDLLNRSLDAGKDVTQRTQDRIEALLRELAKNAEDQAAQVQQVVQDVVERSRTSSEHLVEAIDREIRNVGVATKTDILRLEQKLEALLGRTPARRVSEKVASAAKEPIKKAATATKAAVKKTAPAKKTATAKKTAVGKKAVAATKAPAKKATAVKTAAAKKTATVKKAAAAKTAPAKKRATAKKAAADKRASS